MKISIDWLSDFVDLSGIPVTDVAERLTMATAEVEGIEQIHRSVEGLVISEVLSAEPCGDGFDVEVDCGTRRYRTFCGASNVRKGMKAVFAPAGTKLSKGTLISVVEREGHMSEGVLCSAKEIGMSNWHEGILECPRNVPSGASLVDYIPETDFLIEVDNKSLTNRPDLWGHYGFARELSALLGRQLRPSNQLDIKTYSNLPAVDIHIEEDAECACYCCVRAGIDSNGPSSLKVQRRLHALGQKTINLIVDLTNYVMFELGQPLHAFDGCKVSGIRVAHFGGMGTFTPLDGYTCNMQADDLMIWDHEKPIAIAGVMGGLDTEVTNSTKEILLESANFTGSRIRRTALRLNLRTEASQRFEKDQPPAIAKDAICRFLFLLQDSCANLNITSSFSVSGNLSCEYRRLELPGDFFTRRSGIEIPQEKVISILTSVGFEITHQNNIILCGIPPFRSTKDVSLPVDILEEVLRIYGYDNVAPSLPKETLQPAPDNVALLREHKMAKVLTASTSFSEVHTYSWYDSNWLSKLDYMPTSILTLKNPSASNNSILRKGLIPNLLEVLSRNIAYKDIIRIFEIGRVYNSNDDGSSNEKAEMSAVYYKHGKADSYSMYLELKGIVEKLGLAENAIFSFERVGRTGLPWMADGNFTGIIASGINVGSIGILPDKLLKEVCPHGQVVWCTVDLSKLPLTYASTTTTYKPIPVYPESAHDFSLLWKKSKGYSDLSSLLDKFKHEYIASRDFVTYFDGEGIPNGMASYTIRYILQAGDRTLIEDDIQKFRESFLSFLSANGITVR